MRWGSGELGGFRTCHLNSTPSFHDTIDPGLRRKRSGMHHIYYLARTDTVEVLNILHVQRDPGQHLKLETWRSEEGE